MGRRTLTALILAAAAACALAGSSPEKPPVPVVLQASERETKDLVASAAKATEEKTDELMAQVLMHMETLRNDSFVPIIRSGLKSQDPHVLAAAIRAAASHELKDVEKDVRKLLRPKSGKKTGDVSGKVVGAAVDYLVRLDFAGEEAVVFDEWFQPLIGSETMMKASWSKDLARAAIHYMGEQKYKRSVPHLIEMIPQPAPADPNSASNPPETYWKARVQLWHASESWVRWALKEITGQEFRSHREWQTWLKENKKLYK